MSSIVGRMLNALSPLGSGPLSGFYRLILPGLQSVLGESTGPLRSELKLSMVAPPDYFPSIVKESFESMRFLHGKGIPLKVKVISREASRSLRYGLVQSDHSLQIRGEKRYTDELLAKIRKTIASDQMEPSISAPRVKSQAPEAWLESAPGTSIPAAQSQLVNSDFSLRSIGVVGALVGIVAALAFFSGTKGPERDSLGVAVSHLRKRGLDQLQLIRSESVEGGEKFYFQGATESYTVVVDKDGRVYSWSRVPSRDGA